MGGQRRPPAARGYAIAVELFEDRRVRYVVVGGVAAAVYYMVFSGGWLLLSGHVPYLAMAVVANLVTAVATFPLYQRGVFRTVGPWLPGFLKFYAICFWCLVFTLVGLPLLVEIGRLPVLLAQAVVLVVSPLINYQVNRCWTFRNSG
jgi:putative flippase GtrA